MLRTRNVEEIYGGGGGRKKERQLEREGLGAIVECRMGLEVLLGLSWIRLRQGTSGDEQGSDEKR